MCERPRGSTNSITGFTLTGDQAIGQILDSNQALILIPIAIGPFGELGQIFSVSHKAPLLDHYPKYQHRNQLHILG